MELALSAITRPALRYHGGKWTLAPWIIQSFPPHQIYAEPFGGAASVLLRKTRSRVEVYNDLDSDVVNFFRVLRDPALADALVRAVQLTPFSREEFDACYVPSPDPVEAARRLIARSYFGFGSHSFNAANSNGFRWMPAKPYAKEWANLPHSLQFVSERLFGVTIEHRPAACIIEQQDSPDTLFFLDPPYPRALRDSGGKGYVHEMTDHDHRLLAHQLRRIRGKALICGYPGDLYDRELYPDWTRLECTAYASGQKGRAKRTEVLWANFDLSNPQQCSRNLQVASTATL